MSPLAGASQVTAKLLPLCVALKLRGDLGMEGEVRVPARVVTVYGVAGIVPVPRAFVPATCTSYAVSESSPVCTCDRASASEMSASVHVVAPDLRYCTFQPVSTGVFPPELSRSHVTRNAPGPAVSATSLGSRGAPTITVRAGDQATGAWPLVYAIWTSQALPAPHRLPGP